ncbi:MAG: hypothetical protein GF370_02100 [Candidatus Nealsonbacteria bacterium]|nr:hypothetical protein [Candidatus Nealsonbacteria bacterium]
MITKSRKDKKGSSKEDMFFQFVFMAVVLFFVGSLIVSNVKIYRRKEELTEEVESLKNKIEDLEKEEESLEVGISQTEKESYWEGRAREQGYIKEGEEAVVVLPPEGVPEEEQAREMSFPEEIASKIKAWLADILK